MSGIPNKTALSLVVLLCLILCSPAWSQTNVMQITGQVADSSGAPVAACTVTATNVQNRGLCDSTVRTLRLERPENFER